MNDPTARMLGTLLACSENPDDMRLNPHLSESDIAETIRVACEILEGSKKTADDSAALRAVLKKVSETATVHAELVMIGSLALPREVFDLVLETLKVR